MLIVAPSKEHLVSVITPTWRRHDVLLNGCVPSVQVQDWPHEHVVVSDGPDPELRALLPGLHELPEHAPERHWGHLARFRGLELARGELIAYLDDDDAWEPGHLRLLAEALRADESAGFAFSRALVHLRTGTARIGDGRPAHGRVQTSMIMHRRELLEVASWGPAHPAEDWQLVSAWLAAGVPYVSVDAETVHYYPAALADHDCALMSFAPE